MDVKKLFKDFVSNKGIFYTDVPTIRAYNDSTLFCSAGMQKYEKYFRRSDTKPLTISTCQPCLRTNDFEQIGDSTHLLYFNMLGLFSFNQLSIGQIILVWLEFMQNFDLTNFHVTIHPDKREWSNFYPPGTKIIYSEDCTWFNGTDLSGYCTEFFINGTEVGNIVQIGNHIDCGFGLERLEQIKNSGITCIKINDQNNTLESAAFAIIGAGYKPSATKQGYVLRKILTQLIKNGVEIDHPYFEQEKIRQEKIQKKYLRLKDKYPNKPKQWWYETHGIEI